MVDDYDGQKCYVTEMCSRDFIRLIKEQRENYTGGKSQTPV
jgi:hypothetical protein